MASEDIKRMITGFMLTRKRTKTNRRSYTVTQRVASVKQPYGGYIKPKEFVMTELKGGGIEDLNPDENVHSSLVGIAVDYLSRYITGTCREDAFRISKLGAQVVCETELFNILLHYVTGLDDESIIAAVRLSGFDSAYRAGIMSYRDVRDIYPDKATVENIRTMVNRSLNFFEVYGPKVKDGLTFEGGYTRCVVNGDGDFLTEDTIWDFKVSKQRITTKHTLQLFMYWRMGLHSVYPEYQNVKYLGFYNPRKNFVYRIAVSEVSEEVIAEVESEVIGYSRVKSLLAQFFKKIKKKA